MPWVSLSRLWNSWRTRSGRPAHRRAVLVPTVENLEERTLLTASPILPNQVLADQISVAGETDLRQVTLTQDGLLTISAHALGVGLDTRLTLLRADGELLAQSDGESLAKRDDRIAQNLAAGTYLISVEGMAGRTGDYQLTTAFVATSAPFQQIPIGTNPQAIVLADFNGDGKLDLATANMGSNDVSVLIGVGDGTYLVQQNRFGGVATPTGLVVGDFNGDHKLDLLVTSSAATYNVRLLLGNGDGTFTAQAALTVGNGNSSVAVADLDGDGKLDAAVCQGTANTVTVLHGCGDGTFTILTPLAVGTAPKSIVAADVTGDGKLDLVTANNTTKDLSLLKGNGDGTFAAEVRIADGEAPMTVVAADFNGDGRLDLAASNQAVNNVAVLLQQVDGTFKQQRYATGRRPTDLRVGDFNGDGLSDLVAANIFSNDVSILLGNGDGTFQTQLVYNVGLVLAGQLPQAIAVGDVNGDGQLDVASANSASILNIPNSVSVLLGRGDGSLVEYRGFAAGDAPAPLAIGDFNGDGRVDVVVPNTGSNDVSVLLGLADGTFQAQTRFAVDNTPSSVVVGDFNEDGRLDVALPNSAASSAGVGITISVLLGIGDGTFQDQIRVPAGFAPFGLVAKDINQDGHLDLAAVNRAAAGGDNVSVFFGRGDGTFDTRPAIPVGDELPQAVYIVDLNGDGVLDLVTANVGSRQGSVADEGSVTVMLGRRDANAPNGWTVAVQPIARAGIGVVSLLIDDVNGDGLLDIVAADRGPGVSQVGPLSNQISLFLGQRSASGVWSLSPECRFTVVGAPTQIVGTDLNGDGRKDLIVATGGGAGSTSEVSVLLGIAPTGPDSSPFAPEHRYAVPAPVTQSSSLVVQDFNRDGKLDLAYTTQNVPTVGILLGNGDGTFQPFKAYALNAGPTAMVAADFNGDGLKDIITANKFSDDVTVLLSLGDGTFVPSITSPNPIRSVPILTDVNQDGTDDLVVVSNNGTILYRAGRRGEPGVYAPPVVVNPDASWTARDITVLRRGSNVVIAALDVTGARAAFYTLQANGSFRRDLGPMIGGLLPARIEASDLNRDGRDDLLVVAGGSGTVQVFFQAANGSFNAQADVTLNVGNNPTEVYVVDVDGNGWKDVVTANQFSGDVSVTLNGPSGFAASDLRYRAADVLYGLGDFNGSVAVRSLAGTATLAPGDFNGDGVLDVVAANRGASELALLLGSGTGGLLNPAPSQVLNTAGAPTVVVTGDFNGDRMLDLAVLCEGTSLVQIFVGDGHGGFLRSQSLAAGNVPTGLSVGDVNGDRRPDLLVGNQFGDVLVLSGKGDGTFEPYRRTERTVSLAVADLDGDGTKEFVLANESLDRVVVQYGAPGAGVEWQTDEGILGPEAVKTADINGDGTLDLIVSNGGGNDLLVYLGLGDGQFGTARAFFTGTSPARFTVADLDANGWLDVVVANEGSNDVSVLLGQGTRTGGTVTNWTLAYGPRLNAGYDAATGGQVGLGPVATAVADINGDGVADILVTNHVSNNVALLTGIGNGFFNDLRPQIFDVGVDPRQVLVGEFDGLAGIDFVTIDAGSDGVTFFSGGRGAGVHIGTGGARPTAALAGDFNSDGLSDLVVLHNGNGFFSLLLGGANGPEIAAGLADSDLRHPTDLALAAQRNGVVELFACDEGSEQIFRLTLDFRPAPLNAALLPLRDSELAAVAVLIAGGAETPAPPADAEPLTFQPFVIGLDGDGPGGGDAVAATSVRGVAELAGRVLQEVVEPVAAEFLRTWSSGLDAVAVAAAEPGLALLPALARVGESWDHLARNLFAWQQQPAAPVPPTPLVGMEATDAVPAAPAASDGAAAVAPLPARSALWEHMMIPAVIVTEIGVCMLGVWVLHHRGRQQTALPGKVRRPAE